MTVKNPLSTSKFRLEHNYEAAPFALGMLLSPVEKTCEMLLSRTGVQNRWTLRNFSIQIES